MLKYTYAKQGKKVTLKMKYVFANHKMNLTVAEAGNYLKKMLKTKEFSATIYDRQSKVKPSQKKDYERYLELVEKRDKKQIKPLFEDFVDVAIFPSFLHIERFSEKILRANKRLGVGAQNCHFLDNGAVTGEVSAQQLSGLADYVLVGHSERRQIFHETDEVINLKIKAVIENGMTAVLCVGENREQYERGETKTVIEYQLKNCLSDIDAKDVNCDWLVQRLIIAYEPIWAIGSGQTPKQKEIAKIIKFIKRKVAAPVLYGGSVDAENAAEIMTTPDVDGLLVGGASLDPLVFATIIRIARNGGIE